jgi:decaprenylphospho-beta-D-erythro-pentofuranosid-2-ulose 2-reductase
MAQHVVIFGATSAIASDVARLYAKRGARLYLVGRSEAKLGALVRELGPEVVVGHASQDFDRLEQADACVAQAVAALGHIDVALIAHGVLSDQLETERSLEAALASARTNYLSVMALLIPLANHMEARRSGQLAVLSSVAAERGRPRNYTYAAAKGALNVYLQGLRSRLYRAGVGVHTLKLGPVDTPMTATHEKNALFAQPGRVAQDIVAAIDAGRSEAFVPWYWRWIMLVVRNLPEPIFQRFASLSGR